MTGTFAEGAVRLAGFAGVTFGWSPEAFWHATPAELATLARAIAGETATPLDGPTLAELKRRFPDG